METVTTIDLTPTWGEWGNVYRRMAETGETRALKPLAADFKRAMAAAAALHALMNQLTQEQVHFASGVLTAELKKQGV